MSINDVIIDQIKTAKLAEEKRKADKKRQEEVEEQKKAEAIEIKRKELEKEFNFLKEKIENSGIRQILEIISFGLSSSDENFSLLKNRIIKIVRDDSPRPIGPTAIFSVSEPSFFNGDRHYYISFYYSYAGHRSEIFRIYNNNNNSKHFGFDMNFFQHTKDAEFTSEDKESMAKEIINFLMID